MKNTIVMLKRMILKKKQCKINAKINFAILGNTIEF